MAITEQDICFLVADARSGSTFFLNKLLSYKEICVTPESNFMIKIFDLHDLGLLSNLDKVVETLYAEPKFNDWKIPAKKLKEALQGQRHNPRTVSMIIFNMYRNLYYPETKKVIFSKGSSVTHFKYLREFFKEASYLNMVRDPRACFFSKLTSLQSSTGKPFEKSPYNFSKYWNKCSLLIDYIEESDSHKSILIPYESLILNHDNMLDNLTGFLEIKSDRVSDETYAKRRSYFQQERYDKVGIHKLIDKKPDGSRINRWKGEMSRSDVLLIESYCSEGMKKLSYDFVYLTSSSLIEKNLSPLINSFSTNLSTFFNKVGKKLNSFIR